MYVNSSLMRSRLKQIKKLIVLLQIQLDASVHVSVPEDVEDTRYNAG